VLGAALGLVAYKLIDGQAATARSAGAAAPAVPSPLLVPIAIDLSPALARVLLPEREPSPLVTELLPALRERLFAETGIALPDIQVRGPVAELAEDAYTLLVHEIPVAHGTTIADRASARPAGEAIVAHLHALLRRHGHRFVDVQETHKLLESLQRTHPALVREVVPRLISPVLLADVLERLAKEGISLRHLGEILSALARRPPGADDPAALAELARASLRRQITYQYTGPDGSVGVFFVDSMIEETVREAIRKTGTGSHLALEPQLASDIVKAVERTVTGATKPVIVTAADIRRHLRGLVENEQPEVAVLAYQELSPESKLQTLGTVSI